MLYRRFLLIILALLNAVWAMGHFLGEYQMYLTHSFDPLYNAAPLDSTPTIVWLAIGIISGLAASMLFRAPYRGQRHNDADVTLPTITQLTHEELDMAA
jgi:hypothetical protein